MTSRLLSECSTAKLWRQSEAIVISERIELPTFRVLGGRDNQIHHETGYERAEKWRLYVMYVRFSSEEECVQKKNRVPRTGLEPVSPT